MYSVFLSRPQRSKNNSITLFLDQIGELVVQYLVSDQVWKYKAKTILDFQRKFPPKRMARNLPSRRRLTFFTSTRSAFIRFLSLKTQQMKQGSFLRKMITQVSFEIEIQTIFSSRLSANFQLPTSHSSALTIWKGVQWTLFCDLTFLWETSFTEIKKSSFDVRSTLIIMLFFPQNHQLWNCCQCLKLQFPLFNASFNNKLFVPVPLS